MKLLESPEVIPLTSALPLPLLPLNVEAAPPPPAEIAPPPLSSSLGTSDLMLL